MPVRARSSRSARTCGPRLGRVPPRRGMYAWESPGVRCLFGRLRRGCCEPGPLGFAPGVPQGIFPTHLDAYRGPSTRARRVECDCGCPDSSRLYPAARTGPQRSRACRPPRCPAGGLYFTPGDPPPSPSRRAAPTRSPPPAPRPVCSPSPLLATVSRRRPLPLLIEPNTRPGSRRGRAAWPPGEVWGGLPPPSRARRCSAVEDADVLCRLRRRRALPSKTRRGSALKTANV